MLWNRPIWTRLSFSNVSYITSDLEFYGIDVPVEPRSSDEEWNRIMQVQKIKEKGEQYGDENETVWFFQTKWGRGRYSERMLDDGGHGMSLEIRVDEQTMETSELSIRRTVSKDDVYYSYTYIDGRKTDS